MTDRLIELLGVACGIPIGLLILWGINRLSERIANGAKETNNPDKSK